MISDEVLDLAVDRGVITSAQAQALRGLAADHVPSPPAVRLPWPPAAQTDAQVNRQDDEVLRFVTGFADIFVSLGLVLFFGSSAYFIDFYAGPTGMWVGLVVLSWLVAEFFSRRHRLALPSIILLGLFAGSVFMATSRLIGDLNPTAPLNWWHPADRQGWMLAHAASMALAGLATAALTALHYVRFRVPITIAAMAAALIATIIGLAYWLTPDMSGRAFNGLLLVAGILVFLSAMRFDMADLQRLTRRTDIAFWLHLLAAPLIVHPLIAAVRQNGTQLDTHAAMAVLAIFLGLGLVSLVIDRRALLVSGLTYAGIAFGTLLQKSGFADNTPAATLLALGLFILLLSALWRPLRQAVLKLLPAALVIRLPHSHVSAS
ncbi:MAG: hypothetical protein WCF20_09785 [Methylovirgula sp.]